MSRNNQPTLRPDDAVVWRRTASLNVQCLASALFQKYCEATWTTKMGSFRFVHFNFPKETNGEKKKHWVKTICAASEAVGPSKTRITLGRSTVDRLNPGSNLGALELSGPSCTYKAVSVRPSYRWTSSWVCQESFYCFSDKKVKQTKESYLGTI